MGVFEVAIGRGREPGHVRVEVVRSAAGEAVAEAALDADAVLAGRDVFERVVLVSAVPARQVLTPAEQVVRDTGQVLFRALLGTGAVAGRYEASVALAAQRDEELRIVLRIDAPGLAGLPWEAMYDAGAGGYVCRRHDLLRHIAVAAVPPTLEVTPPLRVLGVISAPRGLPPLDAEREREQLGQAVAGLAGAGLAEVTWAPPTWAGLQEALLDGPWHVLHFIGHGDFDPGRDEGVLALTAADGRPDLVEASRLADLLRQARPMPRLVVLNSCSGAAGSTGDLFSGTAAALARGGVAAVAAMQFAISDPAAVAFGRGFYAALARGRPVDQAVSAGRIAILGTSGRTLEWITPVLYVRGHDTRLFVVPAAPAVQAAAPEAAGRGAAVASRPGPARAESGPGRQARVLTGHAGWVHALAFSPDGALLATLGEDGTIRLWDAVSGASVRTISGVGSRARGFFSTAPRCSVAFSPDGSFVATAIGDREARLWVTRTGDPARVFTRHAGAVTGVAFSPDGTLLATADKDGTARLWDTGTGGVVRALRGHPGEVRGVAFSPDGALLATAGGQAARLWEVATGDCTRTLTGHTADVRQAAFSPDGALVATASLDKTARLWRASTGVTVHTLAGHGGGVHGVAFSPDGTVAATGGGDRSVVLWQVSTGARARTLTGHTDWVREVAFSPDGARLASVSDDETVRLWPLRE